MIIIIFFTFFANASYGMITSHLIGGTYTIRFWGLDRFGITYFVDIAKWAIKFTAVKENKVIFYVIFKKSAI